MDTKTLEQRIREKATIELKQRIAVLFEPFSRELSKAHWPEIAVGEQRKSAHELLPKIQEAIVEGQRPQAEDEAVKQFLARVDELQEQIDELKNQGGC